MRKVVKFASNKELKNWLNSIKDGETRREITQEIKRRERKHKRK